MKSVKSIPGVANITLKVFEVVEVAVLLGWLLR